MHNKIFLYRRRRRRRRPRRACIAPLNTAKIETNMHSVQTCGECAIPWQCLMKGF